MLNRAHAGAAGLAILCAGGASAQPAFTGIGGLPGQPDPYSFATALSADGSVIAGDAWDGVRTRAIRWTWTGGMQSLGDLPGGPFTSYGSGVSPDGGTIVGSTVSPLGREAFRWNSAEGMVGLGDLPGGAYTSFANGASLGGARIVGLGDYEFTAGLIGRATLWDGAAPPVAIADTLSEAEAITPDGSTAAGYMTTLAGEEAMRWTDASGPVPLGDLPGGPVASYALGISDDGGVVVGGAKADDHYQAFRWTSAGGMVGLGQLAGSSPATESVAWACSADGAVVVGVANYQSQCGDSGERAEAFIWTEARGMRRVRDMLMIDYGLDLEGWALEVCTDVSADGRVLCGWGINPEGEYEGWAARLEGGVCRADFDGSGALDFFDFLAFQNAFAAGCP